MSNILFDLGKSKLRIAVTKDKTNVGEIQVFKSPNNLEDALDLLISESQKISDGEISNFTGGITAVLDPSRGEKAKKIIKEKAGVESFIGNDAEIVGLGEAVYGAGKNYKVVQYITVSTGIGGAKIEKGEINKNSKGFEPGNQIINYLRNETLQDLASGSSITKRFGKDPKEMTDPEFWKDLSKVLAVGVYNSILHWMPDVVILGGSMITGDPAIPLTDTENNLKEINKILENLPPIKKAELGDFGGIHGALAFLKQNS